MFIRIKSPPNSPRKSIQFCMGIRNNGKVQQRVLTLRNLKAKNYDTEARVQEPSKKVKK